MPYLIQEEKQSQTDKAISLILKYIKGNNLQPGDRLPSEREMAEQFSMGRQSVREATKVLSMMNILDVRRQGGTFVAKATNNSKYDQFKFFLQSGQISLSEIFEARLIMEVECIALAAKKISEEQLELIRRNISSVDIDDLEGFAEADRVLHDTIYAATGNRALEILMQTVKMWTTVSQGLTNSYREVRELVQKDHVDILDALSRHDAEAAREAMRKHIQHLDHIHYVSDVVVREELAKLLDKE